MTKTETLEFLRAERNRISSLDVSMYIEQKERLNETKDALSRAINKVRHRKRDEYTYEDIFKVLNEGKPNVTEATSS